jgi:3-deoxy-D-manno-octulosonic-acid transferase
MIIETHKTGCSMLQINARISVNSYTKWQKYGNMAEKMLKCFSLSLAQSEDDKTRLEKLGARKAIYAGNLKFDAPALPADPKETGKLVSMIADRPIWIAASTHPGEEKIIFAAHNIIKEKRPNVLTIIVPRHPNTGVEIANNYREKYNLALRSREEPITEKTEIYVANTIGEMGIFYRMASIVFVGGSLVDRGGQNPLEAARLNCALLTGPYTENFKLVYKELAEKNAVITVRDADGLADKVNYLLSDHDAQEEISNRSLALMDSKQGVLDDYIQNLSPYIKPLLSAEEKAQLDW